MNTIPWQKASISQEQKSHLYYELQDGRYYLKFGKNIAETPYTDASEIPFPASSQMQCNLFSEATPDAFCPAPTASNISDSQTPHAEPEICIPNEQPPSSFSASDDICPPISDYPFQIVCSSPAPYECHSIAPSKFMPKSWNQHILCDNNTYSPYAVATAYGAFCNDQVKQLQEQRREDRDNHTYERVEQSQTGLYQNVTENRTDGTIVDVFTSMPDLVLVHFSTNRKTDEDLYCLNAHGQLYPIKNGSGKCEEPTEHTLRKALKTFDPGFRERRNNKKEFGDNLLCAMKQKMSQGWIPYYFGWNRVPNINQWEYIIPGHPVYKNLIHPMEEQKPFSGMPLFTIISTNFSAEALKVILLASLVRNHPIIRHMKCMTDLPLVFVLGSASQAAALHELFFWCAKPDLSDLDLVQKPDAILKKFKTEGDGLTIHLDWIPGYKTDKLITYTQQQMETVATSQKHTVFPLLWSKKTIPAKYADSFIQLSFNTDSIKEVTTATILTLIPSAKDLSLVFDKTEALISETGHSPFGQSLIAAAVCCYPRLKQMDRLDIFQNLLDTAGDLEKTSSKNI